MFRLEEKSDDELTQRLADRGYRPALAARYLAEGRYSRALEICRELLTEDPELVSARLIYARALLAAGQIDSAAEQFYRVLSADPDNLPALKHIGDSRFADGDEVAAFAAYRRVLEIDPNTSVLHSSVSAESPNRSRTITLRHPGDRSRARSSRRESKIPFYTETLGDLYLEQGHPRLAAEVFKRLCESADNPRIQQKLQLAQQKAKEKAVADVRETNQPSS